MGGGCVCYHFIWLIYFLCFMPYHHSTATPVIVSFLPPGFPRPSPHLQLISPLVFILIPASWAHSLPGSLLYSLSSLVFFFYSIFLTTCLELCRQIHHILTPCLLIGMIFFYLLTPLWILVNWFFFPSGLTILMFRPTLIESWLERVFCGLRTCSPLVDRFPTDTANVRKPSRTKPVSPNCSHDHTLILLNKKET